jgi:putative DNA primase/helicase
MRMNALLDWFSIDCAPGDAALAYARLRLRVLPLHTPILRPGTVPECSCWKRDTCPKPGKHPRWRKGMIEHGALDASASEATVRVWWDEWPRANVGIATGEASRLLLLDGDPRHGSVESLQRLERTYGRLPDTWEVRTGVVTGAGIATSGCQSTRRLSAVRDWETPIPVST